MSYAKKTWVTGETIYAVDLNHMEDGIEQAAGASYVPTLSTDWIPISETEEDKCLIYYPEDVDVDPISDADAISQLLLYRPTKWSVEDNDGGIYVRQIVHANIRSGNGNVYINELELSNGVIYAKNERNHFVEVGKKTLAYFNTEGYDYVLAIANELNGDIITTNPDAVVDYLLNNKNKWVIMYTSDLSMHAIKSVQYEEGEPVIIMGNGNCFSVDPEKWAFVYTGTPVDTPWLLHRITTTIAGNSEEVLSLQKVVGATTSQTQNPERIMDELRNGTTPWVIYEGDRAVPITTVLGIDSNPEFVTISCADGYYGYNQSANVFIYVSNVEETIK